MPQRRYRVKRFRLWFDRGPFFYAVYNIRLFFFLLCHKADVIVANDLDTLPACRISAWLKRSELYYDSHEYFTEVPELIHRRHVRNFWLWIEKKCVPGLKHMFTVNDSIAELYRNKYGIVPEVVRNIPMPAPEVVPGKSRSDFGIPEDRKVLIFQGAGINIQRGAEEALEAMMYAPELMLVFAGGGDVIEYLKKQTVTMKLEGSVIFIPRQSPEILRQLTRLADAGLSLDKGTNMNYLYSLPNKLFDYIHAGIPVLVSNLPEVAGIVKKFNIGIVATSHEPEQLAWNMREIFRDPVRLDTWKKNVKLAAGILTWEQEEKKLESIFRDVV